MTIIFLCVLVGFVCCGFVLAVALAGAAARGDRLTDEVYEQRRRAS